MKNGYKHGRWHPESVCTTYGLLRAGRVRADPLRLLFEMSTSRVGPVPSPGDVLLAERRAEFSAGVVIVMLLGENRH